MTETPRDMKAVRRTEMDELRDLRRELREVDKDNRDAHQTLTNVITDLVSDKKALRLVGILVGIALGSVVSTIIWGAERIDEVEDDANKHEAEGMEIGRGLRRDVDRNELEIDRLRKRHGLMPGRDED